jgi:hypothetical protein
MKLTTRALRGWGVQGLIVSLLVLGCGCETVHDYSLSYRLWDQDLRKWNEPSPTPHLALLTTTDHTNLLVEYDAYSEKHQRINRKAYDLLSNQERIRARKAPRFIATPTTNGLTRIPVFEAKTFTNAPAAQLTNYAIIATSAREFSLYPQAGPIEPFQLPVYPESSGAFTHVILTPVAVAGDAAMVGVVAGVVALIGLCESGFSFSP